MVIALVPLLWVLLSVVVKGFHAVSSWVWWTHSQAGMTAFVTGGGAYHALVGTVLQALMSAVISIPIGIFVAIYIVEYGGGTALGQAHLVHGRHPHRSALRGGRVVRLRAADRRRWVSPRSGFAVSLALVLLMIPVIVRATEEMLRIVPLDLREASYALGIPKWKTIVRIVLPAGLSGIANRGHAGIGQGDG